MNKFSWTAVGVIVLAGAATILLLQSQPALARNEVLDIGATMPGFELPDHTGKTYTSAQTAGKPVVLIAVSQKCPWSRGADSGLAEVANAYSGKGFVFLGVDSHRSTPPEEIKLHVDKVETPYPVLKDTGNVYADKLGATVTPELFVFDANHKLVYHGAYDDRKAPDEDGNTNYLTRALDQLLAGKPVVPDEVKAWGCSIKRVRASASGSGAKSGGYGSGTR